MMRLAWLSFLLLSAGAAVVGLTALRPPAATAVHVGDLDDEMDQRQGSGDVAAAVGVWVHGPAHQPVARARVRASWSEAVFGSATCETDQLGRCTLTSKRFPNEQGLQITLTIKSVEGPELQYDKTANHDSDRDSDGTVIRIAR